MLTYDQLITIMPFSAKRIPLFLDPVNQTLKEFLIDQSKIRVTMFIAQLAHESGEFRYVKELASGSAYEGRKDLGNTEKGDGVKFKGRGLIQITGRANYTKLGAALGLDLLNKPELLEEPINAARSAGWFWLTNKLNELAETGDFIKVTKRINGGTNGLTDRQQYWDRAKKVIPEFSSGLNLKLATELGTPPK